MITLLESILQNIDKKWYEEPALWISIVSPLIILIIGAVITAKQNKKNTALTHDINILNAQLNNSHFVFKLRFEHLYAIYKECMQMINKIHELSTYVITARTKDIETHPDDHKKIIDAKNNQLPALFEKLDLYIRCHRPFMNETIYNSVANLLNYIVSVADPERINPQVQENKTRDYSLKHPELSPEVCKKFQDYVSLGIQNISNLIRKDIDDFNNPSTPKESKTPSPNT